jgi:predicted MFS family arabinose efflux permease
VLLRDGMRSLATRLVAARGARGFVDGLVSVVLAEDLSRRGFSGFEVGALVTASLLGSALLTLAVGALGHRLREAAVLAAATLLMLGTGLSFALLEGFAVLCLVAFAGTLNPSGGDVSVFLPAEQSLLAGSVAAERRTASFGRYAMTGALAAALGSLASGPCERAGAALGLAPEHALRPAYWLYAAVGLALAFWYRPLLRAGRAAAEHASPATPRPPRPRIRPVIWKLSALFTLDSFGGGFVVQALLAFWLMERFGLSLDATGAFFFATGILSALSQLASAPLARRIGLVRTMVYTHVPANLALMATAFAPSAAAALACLGVRAALSQMDVPARQALVMSLVPAAERPAAASVTNVPRSLGTALGPVAAGALLGLGAGSAVLFVAGALKLAYDGLLLGMFHALENGDAAADRASDPPAQ